MISVRDPALPLDMVKVVRGGLIARVRQVMMTSRASAKMSPTRDTIGTSWFASVRADPAGFAKHVHLCEI